MSLYDAAHISRPFDDYGIKERERREARPSDRVSFQLHPHYLARLITPGRQGLEAGAGPGCFTLELASAAKHPSAGHPETLQGVMEDEALWAKVLEWELELCREPGALDGGTHILAVLERL